MQKLLAPLLLILPAAHAAADYARVVNRSVEVPALWSPGQHLYVKGFVLPTGPLGELESWLDANAPNWTIVLADNAEGETFTDVSGSTYSGMDAVEHALGKSLPATTDFGKLKHPQTGESSGAFFVIFLRERKFSYYGSDVYDHRRLGEANFTGNLDAPAIQAMRGGGRIADAVKNTVTSIDGELARRIAAEAEAKRRAEERQRRDREEAAAKLAALRTGVLEVTASIAETRRAWPRASGSLLTPPADAWLQKLESAQASLADGRAEEAAAVMRTLETALTAHRQQLADHARGPEKLAAMQKEIDALRLHESSARAQLALLDSRIALKAATDAHADADPAWAVKLEESAGLLRTAKEADTESRREAAELHRLTARVASLNLPAGSSEAAGFLTKAAQALEQSRQEMAAGVPASASLRRAAEAMNSAVQAGAVWEEKRAALTRAGWTGGLASGAAALAAGLIGNRRRRRVRDQASALLAAWESTFREKTDGLFHLLDRTRTSIGSGDTLARSGWTGETAAVAQQTIRDADQLFVMSSAIDRVLEQARTLVRPESTLVRAVNFVARKRYEDAVQLLNEDRLQFAPDDPLRPVLQPASPGTAASEWKGLLGRKEDCEPFSLTFDELIAAFNARAARAIASLDRLDSAWLQISDARSALDSTLDSVSDTEKLLHTDSLADGLFALTPLFDTLIPSARTDQEAADKTAATDPVGAIEGPLQTGARKAADARALCDLVLQFRADSLPRIRKFCRELTQAARRNVWVDESLTALSDSAAGSAVAAVEAPQEAAFATLKTALAELESRTATAVELVNRAAESCLPEVEKTETAVQAARVELGSALGISPDKLLCENDAWNPSLKLRTARSQHAAALAEIDRGDTAAAAAALDAADACRVAASSLIDETRSAFAAWGESDQRLKSRAETLSAMVPAHAAQLRRMESEWAATALVLAPGDTLSNNVRDAESAMNEALRGIASAAGERVGGFILTAAASHQSAEASHRRATELLDEIGAHETTLTRTAQENHDLAAQLSAWQEQLALSAAAPSAMQRSVDQMSELAIMLLEALRASAATGTSADPFLAATALASSRSSMEKLEQQLKADTGLFNDANASAREAAGQIATLTSLAARAQSDQIPDSETISRILSAIPELETSLQSCESRLAQAHEDWPDIDRAADATAAEATRLRGLLGGELEQAEQATRDLQTAANALRKLRSWTGSFGIHADTGAGQRNFEAAREALNLGQYAETSRLADSATREANSALDAAESAERRERQERARREEAARRAAEAHRAAISSSSASSLFSSGGSSPRSGFSMSSSSSSGTSRSGFSSGSGTARSGW